MPSESWLLLWQTLPLTAFVLIQPGCCKAHCGSSTQCFDCWAGPEQLCQRGTFCFTVMSKSVSVVPHREMLLCFCSFLLYLVMKGERSPRATPLGTQCLSTYLCTSASLFFTPSAEHTLQHILGSCLSFHNCILLVPKTINYQHVLFPFSQFQPSSQFTASVLAVNP